MVDISKKTIDALEDALEEYDPGTPEYSAANRAHQSIHHLENLLEAGED